MIRAIVLDDEQPNLELLEYLIRSYCPDIDLLASFFELSQALSFISQNEVHLIFLDIHLGPSKNGFQLLDILKNVNILVIFTTAHEQYASRAFKYDAIGYLVKPIKINELIDSVAKVKERLKMKEKSPITHITVHTTEKIELIKLTDLIYTKSDGNYCKFYLADRTILSSNNMGEYEKLFNKHFYRIHNSFIVNIFEIDHVSKINGGECVMKNGAKIPISRRKKDEFFSFLKEFSGGT